MVMQMIDCLKAKIMQPIGLRIGVHTDRCADAAFCFATMRPGVQLAPLTTVTHDHLFGT